MSNAPVPAGPEGAPEHAPVPERVRAIIAARIQSLPGELARAFAVPLLADALPPGAGVVVTGVGASEGPARYLALLLHASGRRAVFTPLSAFVLGATRPAGEVLIVFSQGLSPNARLALRHAREHAATLLFTSATPERASAEVATCLAELAAAGGQTILLPPDDESGTLVRLVGPLAALVAAARFAAAAGCAGIDAAALARVPALAASAEARAAEALSSLPPLALHRRLAFVAAGPLVDGAHGLRGLWMEGLGAPEPPLWDVLQVAHGPYFELFDEEATLVMLEHEGDHPIERELFDRLHKMMVPPRHAVLRLQARLPPPLGIIDHTLLCTALLLRALGSGRRTWEPGWDPTRRSMASGGERASILSALLALLRQTCRGSAERRVAPWGPGLVPGETKASAAAPRSGERSSANEVCRSSARRRARTARVSCRRCAGNAG